MIGWLTARTIRRAPRRLVLGTLGVAFPVAMLAATLLFVDDADRAMTRIALQPVQTEMRALGRSLDIDMTSVSHDLSAVPAVARAEPFAATNVVVQAPDTGKWTARLIAEPLDQSLSSIKRGKPRFHVDQTRVIRFAVVLTKRQFRILKFPS